MTVIGKGLADGLAILLKFYLFILSLSEPLMSLFTCEPETRLSVSVRNACHPS